MKELYYKLAEKLGRPPTDDEVADALADLIDNALDRAREERMQDGEDFSLLIFLANQR